MIDSVVEGNAGIGIVLQYWSDSTIDRSTIRGNLGGGIGSGRRLTISNSTVSGNHKAGDGGGIVLSRTGPHVISHSTITNNRADSDGARRSDERAEMRVIELSPPL